MFLVFSIIHFRESNQILKDIIYNDDILCLPKDANFSLPIKNPNPLFKNGFRIRILKLTKNWADFGSRIRIRIANPNKNWLKVKSFLILQYLLVMAIRRIFGPDSDSGFLKESVKKLADSGFLFLADSGF